MAQTKPSDVARITSLDPPEHSAPSPRPLWPNGAPGALGDTPDDIPTLTLFLPRPSDAPTAALPAVLILPGGGYWMLADHEGEPIARWLNTLGIAGAVLRYRHAPRYQHPHPLADAARALRTLRARSAAWNLDPNRLGIMGSSAGGHLASTLCTHFDPGRPHADDPIERVSSRPDLAILLYPVITLTAPFCHEGSRQNLLGNDPPPALVNSLCNERQVTPATPPTFIFHTADDDGVPVQNSLMYATACRDARVNVELHVYSSGPHGVGLAADNPHLRTWPQLCAAWLRTRGFASST